MNSKQSLCTDLRQLLNRSGACAVGIARAAAVDGATAGFFKSWLAGGNHGSMAYMERYLDIRLDPRLLLEGAQSIICLAFNYRTDIHHRCIADYALGEDYHTALRRRLQPAVALLEVHGEQGRICVDSAPILERYWAQRSGIGFIGQNRQLIVPEVGSEVLLAEIITTAQLPADGPCEQSCEGCGACLSACPGCALGEPFDARRCLSYLTIEHREPLPEPLADGALIYGCDTCQRVCPHNTTAPAPVIDELLPRPELMALKRADLATITTNQFRRLTATSAISRISAKKIRENAAK